MQPRPPLYSACLALCLPGLLSSLLPGQKEEVLGELVMAIDDQMNRLAIIEASRLAEFNELARAKGIQHVTLKSTK